MVRNDLKATIFSYDDPVPGLLYIPNIPYSKAKYQYNQLQSPDINQQFFWPIMTLIICVKTYKKFGLVAKIGVGTFVCLIYIQNVNNLIEMAPK